MWDERDNQVVRCKLCPNYCVLKPGEFGKCGARKNEDGTLYSLVYGGLSAMTPDPIEKKPLFHFWPGSGAYSISSVGCTLHCKHCQNYHISQTNGESVRHLHEATPKDVVKAAKKNSCKSIAYTYNEPLTFYEFILDCAKLAHSEGVLNVLVTNGYITIEALKPLAPFIDAANVDIKAITDKFYKEICGVPRVKPVLEATKYMKEHGVFIECTNLIIPGFNDTPEEIKELSEWVLKELGPDSPLHFSRFHPMYELSHVPATPVSTITKAREIALEVGLHYVYCGNIPGNEGENTYCPNCRNKVIGRIGFSINRWDINKKNQCNNCDTAIDVVGEYTKSKSWRSFS
ncbi:MAG: AmmeMemoRadiSam system radical SAM enzyme [Candidatus Helarchaeota archaeon]|nr:AmmeMemoRadiSam system radical SAM enzyme [Candidatus Helarchaeota archaeon]